MSTQTPSVTTRPFGNLPNGQSTTLYTLKNSHGVRAGISNYGATLVSLSCPDKRGISADIVLGFDDIQGYLNSDAYMGSTVGRFANRIANGGFTIAGTHYTLATNNGPNHLHGGLNGFDKRVWHAEILDDSNAAVRFTLFSPDGDQGYPGNVRIHCTYRLNEEGQLQIDIDATSDKATPINITNHAYFNLTGKTGSALEHNLHIASTHYTPLNEHQIPSGEQKTVVGTPFDFTETTRLGERINTEHPQLNIGNGYDHNFITPAMKSGQTELAATLSDKTSGRKLEVYTNAPGLQLYTANFLDGRAYGKGVTHERRGAVCLEPQHFPDSPNRPDFPSCIIEPGQRYRHTMIFAVSLLKA